MPPKARPLLERLLTQRRVTATDCWEWTGALSIKRGGYGQIKASGRTMKTHRLAWLLLRGPIPDGAMVLHKCDNPPCFNPVHLYLGDAAMNARDASERGLLRGGQCKGQQQPQSKLTDVAVRDIRRLRPSTSLRALANKYGVSKKAILRVTNGTGWRHVS